MWEFSMESLFGHLCSGTIFAHDKEMISLESQRAELQSSKRRRDEDHDSSENTQKSQSLGASQDQGIKSSSQTTAPPNYLKQSQKRWHASPGISENHSDQSLITMASRLKNNVIFGQRISSIRRSFQDWADRAAEISQSSSTPSPMSDKAESQSRDSTVSVINTALTKSTSKLEVAISILGTSPIARTGEASADITSEESRSTRRKSPLKGTIRTLTRSGAQESPIELSGDSQSDGEVHNSSFVTVPEIQSSPVDKNLSPGSQTSLDDSVFESEESCCESPETKSKKIRRRKDAYRAALGQNGLSWDNDRMISSRGGHEIPEMEL